MADTINIFSRKESWARKNIEGKGQGWDPSVKERKVLELPKLVST